MRGRNRRRYRFEIWADVLGTIEKQRRRPGPLRVSRVRSKANMPYDRFWEHVEEMAEGGLIDPVELEPTTLGQRFLDEFQDVEAFLDRYGLV